MGFLIEGFLLFLKELKGFSVHQISCLLALHWHSHVTTTLYLPKVLEINVKASKELWFLKANKIIIVLSLLK